MKDPETLGMIPSVLAVGFGIIPLEVHSDYVVVGHVPDIYHGCFKFLESYFGREIIPAPIDDKIMVAAISEGYIKGDQINHDTFPDSEFVLKAENETKLINEKQDQVGSVICDLDPEEVVFLETSYHSSLHNLDRPEEPEEEEIESEDIPFKVIDGRPHVYKDPVGGDALVIERRNYCYEGCETRQGISRHEINALPYMIHPTEIQITQVHRDGSLRLYIYDRIEELQVGSSSYFEVPYHFISFGHRYSRMLTCRFHAVHKFRRDEIVCVEEPLEWDVSDTERWFNLGN